MKVNLTKLLERDNYLGDYGKTNHIGPHIDETGGKSPYAFELENLKFPNPENKKLTILREK